MRRFEHPSGKFWSGTITRQMVEVRWGKVGTFGQGRMIPFATEEEARHKLAELCTKQLSEGYTEVADPKAIIAELPKQERWTRRFEGNGNFLELTLDGKRIQKRSGRLQKSDDDDEEEDPLSNVDHESPAAARDIVEKLIKHAVRDGYLLVEETEPKVIETTKIVVAPNPELEVQCRDAPDNPEPWLVFADWLMAHGDVRGELAALRARGKERDADAFYRAHRAVLFGDLELAKSVRITSWRHGFAIAAALRLERDMDADTSHLAELTTRFLAQPIAHFVEALRFGLAGFSNNNDWAPTLDAVTRSPLVGQLRALHFDDYTSEDSEISWTPFGDFSAAWPKLGALEELVIKSGAGGVLGAIDLPALKKFVRISGGLRATELDSICSAHWPALEHLEVWFGAGVYGAEGDVTRIQPILAGRGLPKLHHLGIVNCEFIDAVIEPLAGSRLLPRLRTLDLSSGVMAARSARLLVEHADAFRHLAAIDVRSNLLEPDEVARIQKVLPNVTVGTQRARDDDEDDDGGYRYVALGE